MTRQMTSRYPLLLLLLLVAGAFAQAQPSKLGTAEWQEFRIVARQVDSLQTMFKDMQEKEPALRTNPMLMQARLQDQMQNIAAIFQAVPAKAQAAMKDVLPVSEYNAADLFVLKLAAVATGNIQLAIDASERLITLVAARDSVRQIRRELCQMYASQGKLEKAAQHATDDVLVGAYPLEVSQLTQALAVAYAEAGQPAKAIPYALRSITSFRDFKKDESVPLDSAGRRDAASGMDYFFVTQTAGLLSALSIAYTEANDTVAFARFSTQARESLKDDALWAQATDAAKAAIKEHEESTKSWNKPAASWPEHLWAGGDALTLEGLKGKVVLVDFFATWCRPCIMAFPHLRGWQEKYSAEGLVVVGLTNYQGRYEGKTLGPDDEFKKLRDEFIPKHKVSWAVGVEKNGRTAFEKYGVNGIPHVALIDRKGILRYVKVGAADYDKTEKMIQKLLAEKAE